MQEIYATQGPNSIVFKDLIRELDQMDFEDLDLNDLDQEPFILLLSSYFFSIPSLLGALPFLNIAIPFPSNRWEIFNILLTDDDHPQTSYYAQYRMHKEVFEELVEDLEGHEGFDLLASKGIPAHVQIACVVWRFANENMDFPTEKYSWGVSHEDYMEMIKGFNFAISDVYNRLISWPLNPIRAQAIQNGFEHPEGREGLQLLPRVIGILDSKNVEFETSTPLPHPRAWIKSKEKMSMKLLATCDHKSRFTHFKIGASGKAKDSFVYSMSNICVNSLTDPDFHFPNNGYLLAGPAYHLSTQVVTPYAELECLGSSEDARAKAKFNTAHSLAMESIDIAFEILVDRWRILKNRVYVDNPETVSMVILACCYLHNFCMTMEDPEDTTFLYPNPVNYEERMVGSLEREEKLRKVEGKIIRDQLRSWLINPQRNNL